ncbi:ATP-dependent DNA helicase [Bacillus coahuilensis m2-6]|uniref:ATP-dependent DNA helicase RecG n=1 Tax=Bacillus coahuilensis TaxID=408580 RepID=UPI0007504FFC|nr:ATP-dependent DNA helicase RecG [Bacillus coahuilensis]KUP08632.1 ATP-dependent DNA helicase [Bacillus coahuilensis m2-6]
MSNIILEPVDTLKGVGKETAISLNEMGIHTIMDLLDYLPYRYEDYRIKDIMEATHDERITVQGVIHSEPALMYYGKKEADLTVRLLIGNILVKAVFFNQPYAKSKLILGESVIITGKWDKNRQEITVNHFSTNDNQEKKDYEPIYSLRGSLKNHTFRKFVALALKEYGDKVVDPLPPEILQKYRLLSKKETFQILHFPGSEEDMKQGRRRYVYEEFLLFQLKMQSLRKFQRDHSTGISILYDEGKVNEFITSLPFPLTVAQKRVVHEILTDCQSPARMNRLLQGDVGSGKTVVAAISLYASITAGFQGALMVPTEILAEQHAESLAKMFEHRDVTVALLTSSIKGKKRKVLLDQLSIGRIDILVGTHALIQDEVNFHQLGLVITDEQHRFGVAQRKVLREKGENPNVLFMTATPIPRTLAITVFGEMDVSTIDELPAGRKPIETYWAKEEMLDRVLHFLKKEISKGRQAYVITPLIEESDKLDVQNAIDVHSQLSLYFGSNVKVGLMHGRLHPTEKEQVMKEFSEHSVDILVSTTVVEVGVNVPNATMMIIYDAERFGLSQLHQLRGRVGRGEEQSYCILLANPKTDVGKERMTIMTETTDGFVLSEKDLELRGPGDFFGRKQSGMPEFKMADMVHDYRVLEIARDDAKALIDSPIFWDHERYEALRERLSASGAITGEKLD